MQNPIDPQRRSLVTAGAGLTAAVLIGTGTVHAADAGPELDRQLQLGSLAAAEEELARLIGAKDLQSSATWNWAQTLVHLSQSIEYSMSGFPQPNSWLFQHTAGPAAFAFFRWRGRMSHDLAAPIPGAPALDAAVPVAQAMLRLQQAIQRFRAWSGPLQPHFAYGMLDKPDYERAHALHLANHFSAFRGAA